MYTVLNALLELGFERRTANLILLVADVVALLTIPSVLLRRRGRPLAALSWLLAILAIPVLGVAAWWLLGRTHLHRLKRKKRKSDANLSARSTARLARQVSPAETRLADILPFARRSDALEDGVFALTDGNQVELLVDGREAFPAMTAAIQEAKRSIHAMFYIWEPDQAGKTFRDQLARKAREGVRVYVLVDAVGSPATHGSFLSPLREAGAQVATFLPVRFRPWAPTFNFRNHRKLLVVDEEVAFAGGMNIGNDYEKVWRDLAVAVRGPAVAQLYGVFLEDWFFTTGEDLGAGVSRDKTVRREEGQAAGASCAIIASGPDCQESRLHDAFFLAISQARERVLLATPYFIPSHEIFAALRAAGQRGVDVQIMVPEKCDVLLAGLAARSYYLRLIKEGVRLFEYTDGMLHAKALIVDDWLSVLGSANVDNRSFRLNFELACLVSSTALNSRVAEFFESARRRSREINLASVNDRPRRLVLAESLAHLLSPLL
jgi:cardiolipin synthase